MEQWRRADGGVRIDGAGLAEFVARGVELVEALPVPAPLAVEVGADGRAPTRRELLEVWLAAGLATHVGLAIVEQPGRFVTTRLGTRPAA
ncbi:MAG: hypothetical protein R3C15_02575 [Thermoleophilia bacterium]